MAKPRVMLDTDILVSGLVFRRGNEHEVLRKVEDKEVTLVLPDSVVAEAREVFAEKFKGFEGLLELFLERVKPDAESVSLSQVLIQAEKVEAQVRDGKGATFYAAAQIAAPDYAVTGDRAPREDLLKSDAAKGTRVVTSKELLGRLKTGARAAPAGRCPPRTSTISRMR